jgi:hypothetical protein
MLIRIPASHRNLYKLHVELGLEETTGKGEGIFGTVIAFAPAHEEQGRRSLHSHWQIWTEDLSPQVCEDLWNSDRNICRSRGKLFIVTLMK